MPCPARAYPPPSRQWYYEGEEIITGYGRGSVRYYFLIASLHRDHWALILFWNLWKVRLLLSPINLIGREHNFSYEILCIGNNWKKKTNVFRRSMSTMTDRWLSRTRKWTGPALTIVTYQILLEKTTSIMHSKFTNHRKSSLIFLAPLTLSLV